MGPGVITSVATDSGFFSPQQVYRSFKANRLESKKMVSLVPLYEDRTRPFVIIV